MKTIPTIQCLFTPQTTGAIGFRLDAIKHVDYTFLLKFVCIRFADHVYILWSDFSKIRNARRSKGNRNLFVVSECWSNKWGHITCIYVCCGCALCALSMNFIVTDPCEAICGPLEERYLCEPPAMDACTDSNLVTYGPLFLTSLFIKTSIVPVD